MIGARLVVKQAQVFIKKADQMVREMALLLRCFIVKAAASGASVAAARLFVGRQ